MNHGSYPVDGGGAIAFIQVGKKKVCISLDLTRDGVGTYVVVETDEDRVHHVIAHGNMEEA